MMLQGANQPVISNGQMANLLAATSTARQNQTVQFPMLPIAGVQPQMDMLNMWMMLSQQQQQPAASHMNSANLFAAAGRDRMGLFAPTIDQANYTNKPFGQLMGYQTAFNFQGNNALGVHAGGLYQQPQTEFAPCLQVLSQMLNQSALQQSQLMKPVVSAVSAPAAAAAVQASKLASRKRVISHSDDDDKTSVSSDLSSHKREKIDTSSSSSSEENSEMGLGGESRLKINFSNLGAPGKYPQVFGKSRLGVPHELSGTYVLYSERWRSEIKHEENFFESDDGTKHVLITWSITNLTSGITQSRTETPKEALLRHKDGRTLCNKVFRKALEQRATDLEADLNNESNPIRIKTIKNLIKKLRPKHFSEGPLVFGLRHESVQNRFKSMTEMDENRNLRVKVAI